MQVQGHNPSGLKNYQVATDIQALNSLKQEAKKDQQAALRPVAEQFEALFINQIMKESRKVQLDDGWLDGGQGDFYKQWHDQQMSQSLATKGSLGLADMIVKQLTPQNPTFTPEEFDKMKANQKSRQAGTSEEVTQKSEAAFPVSQANSQATTQSALAMRPLPPIHHKE